MQGGILDDMTQALQTHVQKEQEINPQQDIINYQIIVGTHLTQEQRQYNVELFYAKLVALGMNLDEMKPILEEQGNTLVLSGAGAGKTTNLILKIIYDYVNGSVYKVVQLPAPEGGFNHYLVPSKILVSTFLKSGAEDMQLTFTNWCQKLRVTGIDISSIKFSTIHADVKNALEGMGVHVAVLESTDSIVRSIMQKYAVRNATSHSRGITVDEVRDVQSILSYARNRLDEKRYKHPLMGEYRIQDLILEAMLKDFKLMRQITKRMDFEDMQEVLLDGCRQNPNVINFIQQRYDYVYVDEFQDTAQLQYELLKYYFSGAKRVFVIGDDDQTIYSWRGSDINIITHKFIDDYKTNILKITVNYRCREKILDFVKPSIERNTNRHPKDLKAFKEGGVVNIEFTQNVGGLISKIRENVAKDWTVGVISRTNQDLLAPAIILEIEGNFDFSMSKSISIKARLPKQVFGLIDLVTKRYTDEFEEHLGSFLNKYELPQAKKIVGVLITDKNASIWDIPEKDLKYSTPTLYPLLMGMRKVRAEYDDVSAYIYALKYLKDTAYRNDSVYAVKARTFIDFVVDLVENHPKLEEMNIHEIGRLFNDTLPHQFSERLKYNNKKQIKLTTVHEAKGKEYDSVYIWNAIDGCFPISVGNRDLTPDEFEEERRIFYIAATRAKEELTIYTDMLKRSPFLDECDSTQLTRVEQENLNESLIPKSKQNVTKNIDVDKLKSVEDWVLEYKDFVRTQNYDNKSLNLDIVYQSFSEEEIIDLAINKYGANYVTRESYVEFFKSMFEDLSKQAYGGVSE